MKQIIIFLLIVILAIIGFGQYKKYKRFSLTEYRYEVPDLVDTEFWDQDHLLRYYEAVERLNGYVITQWSAREIDVRNPKRDNQTTRAAVQHYNELMSRVKFYEAALKKSTEYKSRGLTNEQIQMLESAGGNPPAETADNKEEILRSMFDGMSNQELRSGMRNALVYEVQRILVEKGYNIPMDGIYRLETVNAVAAFEEANDLFSDGVVDRLTFEALLR